MSRVWAHRGASGEFPENTMIAFQEAINQKVAGIELDVHLSKDGYAIICHDETLNRTTNGTGFIKDKNLFELKQLDAGSWFDKKFKGIKLPLLDEFLELAKKTNITINIEIKLGSIFYPGIEEKVLELIEKSGVKENVIISSFDHMALLKIKELDNSVKTGVLYSQPVITIEELLRLTKADALHPNYLYVTKETTAIAKELNVPIHTYTVDNTEDFLMMEELGVDVVMTNYPKKGIKLYEEK